jgi:HD superfamily phosphohydrolase YqeK
VRLVSSEVSFPCNPARSRLSSQCGIKRQDVTKTDGSTKPKAPSYALFISLQNSLLLHYTVMCPPSDLAIAKAQDANDGAYMHLFEPSLNTQISKTAYAHAAELLHPAILNHSIRVYHYADALAKHESSKYFVDLHQRDLLFTACLFHDIGTAQDYDGSQRFEVEGADAAVKFLTSFGVGGAEAHEVWTAIACHTSPGIAERIGELARLVRMAVITDFGRKSEGSEVLRSLKEQLEARYERAGVERVLGDAVVEQAKRRPEKAPKVSWPHAMYTAWLAEPEWDGVNKAF